MCGIAGFTNTGLDNKKIVNDMLVCLAHRGLDQEGIFTDKFVTLGHKRLSTIDLADGKQPMEKDGYVIVLDGEIYNYLSLKKELELKGHKFQTKSDTEVLLSMYIEYKETMLDKLNGTFAFIIYDTHTKTIFAGRDPFGVKPFFYYYNQFFAFASEIDTLFSHPNINKTITKRGLIQLFSISPMRPLGETPYGGIFELKPGNYMTIHDDNIKIKEYFSLKDKEHTETAEEAIEHLRELVVSAIKRQLVSDVPVATLLSGGLDSSAISSIVAKEYEKRGEKLSTFSFDYIDNSKYFKKNLFQPTSDEYYADLMAKHLGTNHKVIKISAEEVSSSIKEAMHARGFPAMGDIDSSLLCYCKEISKTHKVVMSGECADELTHT